jgi:signal peptidase II
VGVKSGETGALVQDGLFRFSRNPTFLGQLLLLSGVALAIPALPTVAGVALFFWSASVQIRSEEAVLTASNGADYRAFQASVPRWIGMPGKGIAMSPWSLAGLAALAFAADQVTKTVALAQLAQSVPIPVFSGFNLTLGFNEGASFGMLSGVMAGKPWAMVALTGVITLGLIVIALRARNPWEAAGFALVVGGSLGNIFDRLRQGAVTDFLDFYWRDWHWPSFNMADVAIFIGAGLVLLSALPAFRKTDEHA